MINKIDRSIAYYMTIDTETAGDLSANDTCLFYDLGIAIHDKRGRIYEEKSLVIYDIYCLEKDLMKSAYYAEKLPKYEVALKSGDRKMVSVFTARKIVKELCEKYNVKAITAYNSRFDYKACTDTLRYLTKSKVRYFFPYGVPLYDTLKMARSTICKQKMYLDFCKVNGYTTKNGRPKATAEIVYKYISGKFDFEEEHQGLDDVRIEVAIFAKCMAQHKPMKKLLFNQ